MQLHKILGGSFVGVLVRVPEICGLLAWQLVVVTELCVCQPAGGSKEAKAAHVCVDWGLGTVVSKAICALFTHEQKNEYKYVNNGNNKLKKLANAQWNILQSGSGAIL